MAFCRRQVDALLKRALELSAEERGVLFDETGRFDRELRRCVERLFRSCEDESASSLRPGDGAAGPLWEALVRELRERARAERAAAQSSPGPHSSGSSPTSKS